MTDYYKLYRKQQIQIESLLAELDTRTMERDYWHNATASALKQNKNDNNRLRQDIAKLTDEIERLRGALERIVAYADTCLDDGSVHIAADIALAALEE